MAKQQKLTAKQKSERIKAAQERERKAQEQRRRAEKTKRIFTVVICVILVLALGIPTMALMVMGGGIVRRATTGAYLPCSSGSPGPCADERRRRACNALAVLVARTRLALAARTTRRLTPCFFCRAPADALPERVCDTMSRCRAGRG